MLKFKTSVQNIHFSSDLHCFHDKDFIWKVRGYNSCQEHLDAVIQKWNAQVGADDIVFFLGDFIFGKEAQQNMIKVLERLNFKEIHMMQGNHGSGYRQLKNLHGQYMQIGDKTVHFSPDYMEISVDGQPIVLCHYPIVSFNNQSHGSWMLFGHTHQNIYKSEIGPFLMKLKMMDVGIDHCGRPLSFKEVKEIMDARPLHSFDHH